MRKIRYEVTAANRYIVPANSHQLLSSFSPDLSVGGVIWTFFKGAVSLEIVCLVLILDEHHIIIHRQGVFSFLVTCLVLQIFSVLKMQITCDVINSHILS